MATHLIQLFVFLVLIPNFAPKPKPKVQPPVQKVIVPLPVKAREFVPPETVGVPKDCPFPTVKKPITFQCPCCGLRMWSHVMPPHLPHCHKDGSVMPEVE